LPQTFPLFAEGRVVIFGIDAMVGHHIAQAIVRFLRSAVNHRQDRSLHRHFVLILLVRQGLGARLRRLFDLLPVGRGERFHQLLENLFCFV
jgi:hypothetical protein